MGKAMTKNQIITKLANDTKMVKKDIIRVLDDLTALALKEAKNGFAIPGLGKLVLVNRKARLGRNPQTGETIKIPAKTVLKFRVAKAAKEFVMGKKSKT